MEIISCPFPRISLKVFRKDHIIHLRLDAIEERAFQFTVQILEPVVDGHGGVFHLPAPHPRGRVAAGSQGRGVGEFEPEAGHSVGRQHHQLEEVLKELLVGVEQIEKVQGAP